MYEEIVKFIRDKNRFSPTILYDILRSEYMIDYFALQKTEKVMQRQKVNSIYDINYSILNLSDTFIFHSENQSRNKCGCFSE